MGSKVLEISEKVLVPLSLLGTVCMFIFWFGGFSQRVSFGETRLDKVENRVVEVEKDQVQYMKEIVQRLSSIESEMKSLHNKSQ